MLAWTGRTAVGGKGVAANEAGKEEECSKGGRSSAKSPALRARTQLRNSGAGAKEVARALPRAGVRTTNRWAAFEEDDGDDEDDLAEDESPELVEAEEFRIDDELDEDEFGVEDDEDGENFGDGEWDEEEGDGDGVEVQPARLQALQVEAERDTQIVRALQGFQWMDPATLRHAKEKAALSRKELEQEQQKHRGTKPATVRIWATQRKIAKAEWKLECLQVQRKDLRKKFDEEDGGLEERELEWQQKLQSLRDQLYEGCDEVVVARAKDSLQVDAARTTQGIDDAGYALQELLSRIDDEETRGIVAGMSKSLEDAKEASERLAQWDSKRDKKPKLEERRGGNEVESERKEAEMGEKEAVAPPAHWMQPAKPKNKMGDEIAGKGEGQR